MADFWDKEFEVPIPLASGGSLVTLRDAGNYIDKLPKPEQASRPWQLAASELQRAATEELAWRIIARIAIIHALYRDVHPLIGSSRGKKKNASRSRTRVREMKEALPEPQVRPK